MQGVGRVAITVKKILDGFALGLAIFFILRLVALIQVSYEKQILGMIKDTQTEGTPIDMVTGVTAGILLIVLVIRALIERHIRDNILPEEDNASKRS